jgi:hypothetical protein
MLNNMESNQKQLYEVPATEVVEVVQEGVLCDSNIPMFGDSFGWDED